MAAWVGSTVIVTPAALEAAGIERTPTSGLGEVVEVGGYVGPGALGQRWRLVVELNDGGRVIVTECEVFEVVCLACEAPATRGSRLCGRHRAQLRRTGELRLAGGWRLTRGGE